MTQQIERTLKALKANRFGAQFAPSAAAARALILDMIPQNASVGIGDSVTLRQIGMLEALIKRGNNVINPFTLELTIGMSEDPAKHRLFKETTRKTFGTDVFLTGSNAVTEDGKIVNIDRAGNRVAGIIYGADVVILVIGRNKIVNDADEAVKRIKGVIAPAHAGWKKSRTPCAAGSECTDCASVDRMCNITVILEKRPINTDVNVILIDEDLGLGWDPDWDEKRVRAIESNYRKNTWSFKKE